MFFNMVSVPVWINVEFVSSHPNETHKRNREQWFGGHYELAGFRNGAPYYSNLKESHYIHCRPKKWLMAESDDFKANNGSNHFSIITSG